MPTDPEQILAHVEATRQGVSALGHERDSAEQLAAATQIAYDALKTEYDAHMATHGPTTPPPQAIYFGIYDGNPSEDPRTRIRNLLGSPAMVTYTYIINQRINVSYEIARVTEDGSLLMIGIDTKGQPGLLYRISQREAAAMEWLRTHLRDVQQIAAAAKAAGTEVVVNLAHEWEVKLAKGIWTDTRDADQATYVRAHDVFTREVRAVAPDAKVIYVCGGWSGNRARIGQIIDGFTEPFEGVGWDPYVTSNTAPDTSATTLFGIFADWLKAQPFYTEDWEFWIPEFGFYRLHGAEPMAEFYSGVAEAMDAHKIRAAILFNRDPGGTHQWKIDTVPQAVSAVRAEIDSIRNR